MVRSRIAELNAELEQLKIAVEQQKITLELNYLFVGSLTTNNMSKSPQQTIAQREEK